MGKWRYVRVRRLISVSTRLSNQFTNSVEKNPFSVAHSRLAIKTIPAFMEHEGSLPCPQEPAAGPYPEPVESSPSSHTLIL